MKKYQLKDFSQFLEEVTIKGSEGIPGEGDDKDERKYLDEVERRARQRLGVPREENPRMGMPRQTMETGREMMQILQRSQQIIRGKEDELERLAEEIILRGGDDWKGYGSILDNVDLDIKLVRPGEVKQFMDDEGCESEDGSCETPSMQLLNDPEIKKEVDKRKILNNITQGEAKNTKRILALSAVRRGLEAIFGESEGREIHTMWMRMTELADKMDWLIPVDLKGEMMERAPEGLAGAVSVKWPNSEKDGDDKDKKSEAEKQEELADKILKDLEKDGDIDAESEDIQKLMSTGNPIIKARGVDFPMLLHETVKGIYELIAAAGIPEDKRTAELVMMNTSSFEDEAEEFRYGPEIAADLRDFINKSTKDVDKYPNTREHVYGMLVQMPADEFLILMKKILLGDSEAREKIDEMIEEVVKMLDEYELGEALPSEQDEADAEEWTKEVTSEEESEIDKLVRQSAERESERDMSDYTQREIQDMIDAALDDGNIDEVKRLSQYLKEGKEIFLKEIERINENHAFHGRRKQK